LTNDRIEAFDHGRVTFRYVCSRTHQTRRLTLPAQTFIARFLQHVLPKGFAKIRAYGLFRPAATHRRERARQLLQQDPSLPPPSETSPATTSQPASDSPTPDIDRHRLCPECQRGHLIRLRILRLLQSPSRCRHDASATSMKALDHLNRTFCHQRCWVGEPSPSTPQSPLKGSPLASKCSSEPLPPPPTSRFCSPSRCPPPAAAPFDPSLLALLGPLPRLKTQAA
jgi:hypothetical protein